jgi:hypothetical protein
MKNYITIVAEPEPLCYVAPVPAKTVMVPNLMFKMGRFLKNVTLYQFLTLSVHIYNFQYKNSKEMWSPTSVRKRIFSSF